MNLKPSPSRLSKQKQRPDRSDEYSLPQKSNPRAPAPTQKPGSSRDRLCRKRKPQGKSGAGETREPLSCFPTLMGLVAPPSHSQGHPHPFHAPKRLRPSLAWSVLGRCPRHNRERVKHRCSRCPGGTGCTPSPLNSRVETSPWLNWLADRFPGCPLHPKGSGGHRVGGCGSLQTSRAPPQVGEVGWSLSLSWASLSRPNHPSTWAEGLGGSCICEVGRGGKAECVQTGDDGCPR